jgi:hypothetical protein
VGEEVSEGRKSFLFRNSGFGSSLHRVRVKKRGNGRRRKRRVCGGRR